MKDPNNPNKYLRKAYIQLLAGVKINNVPVLLYDKRLPPDIEEPPVYMLFNQITKLETGRTKCDKDQNVAVQLDLIYKAERGFADSEVLDDLEDQVTAIITPDDIKVDIDLLPYFVVDNTFLDQNVDLPIETATETVLRRVLRFRHVVAKNVIMKSTPLPPPPEPPAPPVLEYPFEYGQGYGGTEQPEKPTKPEVNYPYIYSTNY